MPAPKTPADRALLVSRVDRHLGEGKSIVESCLLAGLSRANYYRWQAEAAHGAKEVKKVGRKAVIELTEMEVSRLRFWRLTRGSVPLALAEFAKDELCRPEVGQWIIARWREAVNQHRRPSWPMSIRRALFVTEAVKGAFRGEKHLDDTVATERRGNFWRDEEGQDWPLAPNSIFESDDESTNQPYRYTDPATGQERLGRQSLKTIDTCSLKWLGLTHVGRERDAYRVEDIADHFTDIVKACGLPVLWRVERGVWDNNWLFGIKLDDGTRWGGLDKLFHIRQKHKSRGKANIEGGFGMTQPLRDHGTDGGIMSLGHHRGEFENATKHYLRAQSGNEDSLAKFWSISESADAELKAFQEANETPRERHAHGGKFITPNEAYGEPVKREVPASEMWRFCPVKSAKQVTRGVVEIKVPHYPTSFRFRVNGAAGLNGLHFDHGHKVLVAFHPGHPEQGCHLFNADMGSKNREAWAFSQFLGMAEHMPDRPQEDLSGTGDFSTKRREIATVRREFRAITAGTARTIRKSHAQDHLGNVIRQASGAGMGTGPALPTRGGLIIPARDGAPAPAPARRTNTTTSPARLSSAESLAALAESERHLRGSALML